MPVADKAQSPRSAREGADAGPPLEHPKMDKVLAVEPRNMIWLSVQQIVLRIGWIFKTESVIMPAFLDLLAGSTGVSLRSWLPLLNRFCQSVPPLFLAGPLANMRKKKRALTVSCVAMSLPFLILAAVGFATGGHAAPLVMAFLFLAMYSVFFVLTGMTNLAFGTVQGKLIRPIRRGRLMGVSSSLGAAGAVICAWLLMPRWLEIPDLGYYYLFGFTGLCFVVAGCSVLFVREPGDVPEPQRSAVAKTPLRASWHILRSDANFRRLAVVASLFSASLMLFPHYQAFGREYLGLDSGQFMYWVVAQNLAAGLISLIIGPLADRRGNRITMGVAILIAALPPITAILLSSLPQSWGKSCYWIVFGMVGMSPVTIRTMNNYVLEICAAKNHPRYLSTLNVCLAVPFVLSPALGPVIEYVGFRTVFLVGSCLVGLAAILTLNLAEPRHAGFQHLDQAAEPAESNLPQ